MSLGGGHGTSQLSRKTSKLSFFVWAWARPRRGGVAGARDRLVISVLSARLNNNRVGEGPPIDEQALLGADRSPEVEVGMLIPLAGKGERRNGRGRRVGGVLGTANTGEGAKGDGAGCARLLDSGTGLSEKDNLRPRPGCIAVIGSRIECCS